MNNKVVLFIIVATAIIAIAGFILISFLLGPKDASTPAGPVAGDGWQQDTRNVDGQSVIVRYDPNKTVSILPPPVETVPPEALPPTETPIVPPEATPPAGETTPVPVTPPIAILPTSQPIAPTPAPDKYIFVQYTVGPNDTLFSVSQYHINRGQPTSVALMARFGIDATDLVAGASPSIPVANPAYCPGLRTHIVLESENAFRIAQRYGITVDYLRQLNNLDANYTVYVTDVLCVP